MAWIQQTTLFFSSPSFLQACLYLSEDFWECDVCVCVRWVWVFVYQWVEEKKCKKEKHFSECGIYHGVYVCVYSLYIMLWVCIYVRMDFLPANMRCVYPIWNRKAAPWGPDHAWTANPESELFGVWNTRSSPWEISSRSLTLTMKDMLSLSLFLSL